MRRCQRRRQHLNTRAGSNLQPSPLTSHRQILRNNQQQLCDDLSPSFLSQLLPPTCWGIVRPLRSSPQAIVTSDSAVLCHPVALSSASSFHTSSLRPHPRPHCHTASHRRAALPHRLSLPVRLPPPPPQPLLRPTARPLNPNFDCGAPLSPRTLIYHPTR
jgi:hypothetical protein